MWNICNKTGRESGFLLQLIHFNKQRKTGQSRHKSTLCLNMHTVCSESAVWEVFSRAGWNFCTAFGVLMRECWVVCRAPCSLRAHWASVCEQMVCSVACRVSSDPSKSHWHSSLPSWHTHTLEKPPVYPSPSSTSCCAIDPGPPNVNEAHCKATVCSNADVTVASRFSCSSAHSFLEVSFYAFLWV